MKEKKPDEKNTMISSESRLQLLVSALGKDPAALPAQMGLIRDVHPACDIIIINQCEEFSYLSITDCSDNIRHRVSSDSQNTEQAGYPFPAVISRACTGSPEIRIFNCHERGVGLSRNLAFLHSDAGLILFSDDDIVYDEGFADRVVKEFDSHPEADLLLFNVQAAPGRETYHNDSFGRVHIWNSGRYPAYSIAARRESLLRARVAYSLLFGGGARFLNGEDSLFLRDCLKAGLRIYKTPVSLGHEVARSVADRIRPDTSGDAPPVPAGSTWFTGYDDRFYHDRGVLYHYLYGLLALPMSLRFLMAHKEVRGGRSVGKCLRLMRSGISDASKHMLSGIDLHERREAGN